jgi:cellulose biosynthesis protein BcsQ
MTAVVSVINYKGSVGKTTLTANIGAELARTCSSTDVGGTYLI